MLDFGRNWLAHLGDAGANNILVGVYEASTAAALLAMGVPCLDMSELVEIDPKGVRPEPCRLAASDARR